MAARAEWKPPSAARVRRVRDRLRETYGTPALEPHGDALGELILTVLSQSTNDRNRDVAYLRLRERLPSWEEVRDAPVGEVEEAIRPGGISKVKSARIQAILRAIAPEGAPSLDFLRGMGVAEAREYLCGLPGDVGVDRVGQRLRLLQPGASFEVLHDQMLALTPPGAELELHVNLLRHGRRTCHARSPHCGVCPLARMCPSRQAFGTTRKAITT